MRNGIFIPPAVVRAVAGAVAATVLALVLSELPEARRYLRMKAM
ncbi:DUF6893 family small protein [Streptomyces sp. NPDC018031]